MFCYISIKMFRVIQRSIKCYVKLGEALPQDLFPGTANRRTEYVRKYHCLIFPQISCIS